MNIKAYLSIGLSAFLLSCGLTTTPEEVEVLREDRIRDNAFIFGSDVGIKRVLAKQAKLGDFSVAGVNYATQTTRMDSATYVSNLDLIEHRLVDSLFIDSIPYPLNYSCKINLLALYWKFGTIVVGSDTVLSQQSLEENCVYVGDDSVESKGLQKVAVTASGWPSSSVTIKNGDYKMIGESWNNFGGYGYASTGGMTSFHKYREKYWPFGSYWYEVDADRISIRSYYFECSKISDVVKDPNLGSFVTALINSCAQFGPQGSSSDLEWKSAYTEEKSFAFNFSISGSFNESTWDPRVNSNFFDALAASTNKSWISKIDDDNAMTIKRVTKNIPSQYQASTVQLAGLATWFHDNIADRINYIQMPVRFGYVQHQIPNAVVSMHSVDHGTMKFRAMTSSGLGSNDIMTEYNSWSHK